MWISRVRVTGGFLAGFDAAFDRGLNVVIGPRGAGKTTLLELIRHALGAQHADGGRDKERDEFLSAILGPGEIIVDLEDEFGGTHLVVDAKGGGQRSDLSDKILVLGQNELESIASNAQSRLNLLDLRTGVPTLLPDLSRAGDLTVNMFEIRSKIEALKEVASKRTQLLADRDVLRSQEASLLGNGGAALAEKRERLRGADQVLLESSKASEKISEAKSFIAESIELQSRQVTRLEQIKVKLGGLAYEEFATNLLLEPVLYSRRALASLLEIEGALDSNALEVLEKEITSRALAAPLREELEQAEAGLGIVTSQLRNIEGEMASLESQAEMIRSLEAEHETLHAERKTLLDIGEADEEKLFSARSRMARETTAVVSGHVVVAVEHLSDFASYRSFLGIALRGTNTRGALVDLVAQKTLPRQLLEFVEKHDAEGLALVIDVPIDRADRVIDGLSVEDSLRELAMVRVRDSVDFRLRDGALEKSVDALSTGQKCAVTLPIVLSERERTLVLDQPEDHLDNAYLVTHVVRGMQQRTDAKTQTIVATHNANIPVLGSANRVLVMASDGYSGSIRNIGAFNDVPIVDAITKLMEGGREAFAARSDFYASHGSKT